MKVIVVLLCFTFGWRLNKTCISIVTVHTVYLFCRTYFDWGTFLGLLYLNVHFNYVVGCQYKLKNETGSLTSQRSYPDFQYCSWSITVTAPLLISLKFHNLSVPNCEENFIDIYDGKGMEESTMLARFCGNNATSGTNIASKTNNLYIVFKSGNNSAKEDGNTSKSLGFNAKYEAFEPGNLFLMKIR